jgi:hypothetical protein
MMSVLYIIGAVVLGLLGFAGLVEALFDIRRCLAARHWESTMGQIHYSRVVEEGVGQDDYSERHCFKYEFKVDGNTYNGKRIHAGQELDLTIGGSDQAWSTARRDADHYTAGTRVRVYYDPRNPRRCCLQTGGWAGIVAKVLFCAGLMYVGLRLFEKYDGRHFLDTISSMFQ